MVSADLFMKKQFNKGMTLIELILAMIVLAVGLSGILSVMVAISKNSVDPQLRWQVVVLGDTLLKSLLTKDYDFTSCPAKKENPDFSNLCDYQGIKNAKLDGLFPELKSELKNLQHFTVSVEIEPLNDMQSKATLVSLIVSHSELGETHLSAVKAKGLESHEQAKRFYTY